MRPRRSRPTWSGLKKSIGNNGFANSPGDPPAFCFYRPHRAGQGTYSVGFRMPWPIVGPYTLMGPEEWDYSHLCRQDRFTQTWLEAQGTDYDVLSDTDLHLDPQRPRRLQGAVRRRAQRILVVRRDGGGEPVPRSGR